MTYPFQISKLVGQSGIMIPVRITPDPAVVDAVQNMYRAMEMYGYTRRPVQEGLSALIADYIITPARYGKRADSAQPLPLIVEAPTGSGKSLAYVVAIVAAYTVSPGMRQQAVVTTGTTALQSQLLEKDVPAFNAAQVRMGTPFRLRARVFAGLRNWICLYRAWDNPGALHDKDFDTDAIEEWVLGAGEHQNEDDARVLSRATFPGPARLWRQISTSADACLGRDCPRHETCPGKHHARLAHAADLMVGNHTLLAMGAVSPDARPYLVVDEAHELPRYLRTSWRVGLGDMPRRSGPTWMALFQALLARSVETADRNERYADWYTTGDAHLASAILDAAHAELAEPPVEGDPAAVAEDKVRRTRLALVARVMQALSDTPDHGYDVSPRSGRHLVVDATNRALFVRTTAPEGAALLAPYRAAVLMSATAGPKGPGSLMPLMGLPKAAVVVSLPSPFDTERSRVYYPDDMPDPRHSREAHLTAVVARLLQIADGLDGAGMLCLFTSKAAEKRAADALAQRGYPVFSQAVLQAEQAVSAFKAHFQETGRGLLMGTNSLMVGVDIPGLAAVVLDKLPFSPPGSIDMAYKAAGLDVYNSLALPNMLLMVRQAAGRAIRRTSDRAFFAVLDPRAARMVGPIPHMGKVVTTLDDLAAWWNEGSDDAR